MSNVLSWDFEELPLVIHNGIEAGLINGMAEIRYSRDGEWEIESVCVEGYVNITSEERKAGKRPWVYVPAPAELEVLITDRLEGEWRGKVSTAVYETLAGNRADAAEMRADMRRDARIGL